MARPATPPRYIMTRPTAKVAPHPSGLSPPPCAAGRPSGVKGCPHGAAARPAMTCITDVGPKAGPILSRDQQSAVGILQARDNHRTMRMALEVEWNEGRRALWELERLTFGLHTVGGRAGSDRSGDGAPSYIRPRSGPL